MASLTQTTFDAMLKELYPGDTPMNIAAKNHPFLAMVNKPADFYGDLYVVPLQYGLNAGRSATFSDAQGNAASSKTVKFTGAQKSDYAVCTVDALTIMASENNRGAFVKARKQEVDSMLVHLGKSLESAMFRSSGGAIGKVSAESTTTLTLTNAGDAANFEVGMVLEADTVDGGGTLHTGSAVVSGIDEDAGTLTSATNWTTQISSLAADDFLFVQGDYGNKITGLKDWLPLSAPGATAFHGVARNASVTKLGGNRLDATGNPIEENILKVAEKIAGMGGTPDVCFINHTNFNNLIKSLGSKVDYDLGDGGDNPTARWGFGHVTMHTSGGPVKVIPAPLCPEDRGYVLQMNTWILPNLGGVPHLVTDDGASSQRQASADGIEIRARYYAELFCRAPGYNGVFSI